MGSPQEEMTVLHSCRIVVVAWGLIALVAIPACTSGSGGRSSWRGGRGAVPDTSDLPATVKVAPKGDAARLFEAASITLQRFGYRERSPERGIIATDGFGWRQGPLEVYATIAYRQERAGDDMRFALWVYRLKVPSGTAEGQPFEWEVVGLHVAEQAELAEAIWQRYLGNEPSRGGLGGVAPLPVPGAGRRR